MQKLTTTQLRVWFKEYNKKYFNNTLNIPMFVISNTRRALGDFNPLGGHPRIRISVFYQREEKSYQQTLIHEMIHLWQWQTKTADRQHGYDFKRKAKEINRDGWNISRTTKLNFEEKSTAPEVTCYIMTWLNTKGIAVSRLSDSSVDYFFNYYYGKLTDCRLYKVKGNYFQQFKKCCSKITYYTHNQREFDNNVKPYIVEEICRNLKEAV